MVQQVQSFASLRLRTLWSLLCFGPSLWVNTGRNGRLSKWRNLGWAHIKVFGTRRIYNIFRLWPSQGILTEKRPCEGDELMRSLLMRNYIFSHAKKLSSYFQAPSKDEMLTPGCSNGCKYFAIHSMTTRVRIRIFYQNRMLATTRNRGKLGMGSLAPCAHGVRWCPCLLVSRSMVSSVQSW